MRVIFAVKNASSSATRSTTAGFVESTESRIVKLSSNCDLQVFHVMSSVSQPMRTILPPDYGNVLSYSVPIFSFSSQISHYQEYT